MSHLASIIDQAARKLGRRLRVALPGRIVDYDGATQTATVELQVELPLPKIDARGEERVGEYTHEELPRLHGVPVGHPRGGGFFVHFPLVAGDYVDVLFADVSLEEFIRSGSVSRPKDVRTHDLFPRAIPTSDPSEGGRIGSAPAGDKLVIGSESGTDVVRVEGDLDVTGDIECTGEVTAKFGASSVGLSTHTHNTAMGPSGPPNPGT